MNPFGPHLLSVITFVPFAGALLLFLLPDRPRLVSRVATAIVGLDLLLSLPLWFSWEQAAADAEGFRFIFNAPWVESLGIGYRIGVDGISMLMVLLTTLLGFIAVLSSWTAVTERTRPYYAFLLMLQTGMLGVFISLDMFLFYVFWEVMLIPMYFLIGVWGGARRRYAAIKFFLYTLAGSLLMLLGILALVWFHAQQTGITTFDVRALHTMGTWTDWFGLQQWIWWAFFLGFAIKVPMVPFHTWLPDAHVEAPTAGSVILAGVLLKMGTYGFLRFSLPIMPEATHRYLPMLLTLCAIGVIYGAMVAMVQKDWKKLVAYSSVSHLGFAMLGIFALNTQGLSGGVLQMVNHGISTGGLFLLIGMVYERRHTRKIADFGGLWKVMPLFGVFFLVLMLSSIGMPALNGFVGEFTILHGLILLPNKIWTIFGATGLILGAAYMLWLYQRTMFGKLDRPENEALTDLTPREIATLLPLVALAFWIGIHPGPVLEKLEEPIERLIVQVGAVTPDSVQDSHAEPASDEH